MVRGVQDLGGVRMVPPVRIQELREAVEEERRWFEFGWWQGFRQCEERINAAHAALATLLLRLQYVSRVLPPFELRVVSLCPPLSPSFAGSVSLCALALALM